MKTPAQNTLFYGDNLAVMRAYIADESVDLVYLDPPFNPIQMPWQDTSTFKQAKLEKDQHQQKLDL